MRGRRRGGQAGTVAGARVGELLRAALREPRVGAAHGHRRGGGAPGGRVDALRAHHHGALLVYVLLLLLLLALAEVVAEVLALPLGQHLNVEGSLQGEKEGGAT